MQEDENKGVGGGATGEVVENKGVSLQGSSGEVRDQLTGWKERSFDSLRSLPDASHGVGRMTVLLG
jgi:hypothetical protein